MLSSCDRSLVCGNSIAIRGIDFERAFRKVHAGISAKVLAKVIFLFFRLQAIAEFLQAWCLEQSRLCGCDIVIQHDMLADDRCDVFFADVARRMIKIAILADGSPVVDLWKLLEGFLYTMLGVDSYMVYQGVGENVIVGAQLRQGEPVLLFERIDLSRHCDAASILKLPEQFNQSDDCYRRGEYSASHENCA